MIDKTNPPPDGKTVQIGFRIPTELYKALQQLKQLAHPRLNSTELYVEALKLYVELGERFGLDKDLRPLCEYQKPGATIPELRPQKGGRSRSA